MPTTWLRSISDADIEPPGGMMVCACPSPSEKVGRALGMVVRPQIFGLKTLRINPFINVVMVYP